MHFPAAQILFEKDAVFVLCGAEFSPTINNKPVPMHHPIAVRENSLLKMDRMQSGARCYLALLQGIRADEWMGSSSTHLKTGLGGHEGRALARYDGIAFEKNIPLGKLLKEEDDFMVLHWTAHETIEARNELECVIGSEWNWLDEPSRASFTEQWFQIGMQSDRMGYRLSGGPLRLVNDHSLISSGVSFGTVQLPPAGHPIILMADHQTTGGYPRIAHVISAHLPLLAQKKPGDALRFRMSDLAAAEEKMVKQQKYLQEIQIACKFKIENLFHAAL
jgi:antagonist of KipI